MNIPKCPKCNKERWVVAEAVLKLSMPPQQEYFCQQCHYSWHVVAEHYTAKEATHESED